MIETKQQRLFSSTRLYLALLGLIIGILLGIMLRAPLRMVVLYAVVGLAVGWFGYGARERNGNHDKPAPFRVEDHVFSPDQARQYLDDFLVKQQRR